MLHLFSMAAEISRGLERGPLCLGGPKELAGRRTERFNISTIEVIHADLNGRVFLLKGCLARTRSTRTSPRFGY